MVKTFTEEKSAKRPGIRTAFEEMMAFIEAGHAGGILCWKISRLSRNPVDSGRIQWALQQGIIQSIQTSDREYLPQDKALILAVEDGLNSQFIRDLVSDTRRGIAGKVKKGQAPYLAPLGYLNDKHGEKGASEFCPTSNGGIWYAKFLI